jgi:valine dehydrogenase (NAD+)
MTAIGILSAMEATSAEVWGTPDLAGRHVAVSGLGKVGGSLAKLLIDKGCRLTVADVSAAATSEIAALGKVDVLGPEKIHRVQCDVFAPCALGGVLNEQTVPELGCRVVVGAANNQLSSPEIADLLESRGVMYLPDFVANAGGIINIAHEYLGYDENKARAHVQEIYGTTADILRRARDNGVTPLAAAMTLAEERLSVDS